MKKLLRKRYIIVLLLFILINTYLFRVISYKFDQERGNWNDEMSIGNGYEVEFYPSRDDRQLSTIPYDVIPYKDGFVSVGWNINREETPSIGFDQYDASVKRFDNEMNLIWNKVYAGGRYDYFYQVVESNDNDLVLL